MIATNIEFYAPAAFLFLYALAYASLHFRNQLMLTPKDSVLRTAGVQHYPKDDVPGLLLYSNGRNVCWFGVPVRKQDLVEHLDHLSKRLLYLCVGAFLVMLITLGQSS